MVVTDLDGTLLNGDRAISTPDRDALLECSRRNVVRVIATGRSLYSAHRALSEETPIDYLVFSSGAGVVDWRSGDVLLARGLAPGDVQRAARTFVERRAAFMIHYPIPENHRFVYHDPGERNPDFRRRLEIYKDFATPMTDGGRTFGAACQLVGIIPNDPARFDAIRDSLPGLNVIRTTSPLDGRSIWVEVFPPAVSKASAAAWLAARLGVPREGTLGVGNDYNDLDLLAWTGRSMVVANAPDDLKSRFPVTASNEEHGFSRALARLGVVE